MLAVVDVTALVCEMLFVVLIVPLEVVVSVTLVDFVVVIEDEEEEAPMLNGVPLSSAREKDALRVILCKI